MKSGLELKPAPTESISSELPELSSDPTPIANLRQNKRLQRTDERLAKISAKPRKSRMCSTSDIKESRVDLTEDDEAMLDLTGDEDEGEIAGTKSRALANRVLTRRLPPSPKLAIPSL